MINSNYKRKDIKFMKSRNGVFFFIWLAFLCTCIAAGCNDAGTGEPVGLERFVRVHQLLEDHVEQGFISGASALVIEDGEEVYRDYVGWMDLGKNRPVSSSTIFRIASMTKAITSVGILMLQEENLLELSDPLSKYIPEFSDQQVVVEWVENEGKSQDPITEPADRCITIHDLLTHTSGLTYGFIGDENFSSLYKQAGISDGLVQTDITLAEFIDRLAGLPLKHQPGTHWEYGLSSDVLGRVIEIVSGLTLEDFFRERIFEPLGMRDTHFFLPMEKIHRLARLYTTDSNNHIIPVDEGPLQAGNLIYSADFQYNGPGIFYSGGAGLVSTLDDYCQFLKMLLNGGELKGKRLLTTENVRLMRKSQIGSISFPDFAEHGDTFGYGFAVVSEENDAFDVASPGSYSWGGLFNTYYWTDPQKDVIGILMTQIYPYNHLTLRQDFKKKVYEVLSD